jgi:hypothetical protein
MLAVVKGDGGQCYGTERRAEGTCGRDLGATSFSDCCGRQPKFIVRCCPSTFSAIMNRFPGIFASFVDYMNGEQGCHVPAQADRASGGTSRCNSVLNSVTILHQRVAHLQYHF